MRSGTAATNGVVSQDSRFNRPKPDSLSHAITLARCFLDHSAARVPSNPEEIEELRVLSS